MRNIWRWRIRRDYQGFSSAVYSGIRFTRNTTQGVGNPTSSQRPGALLLVPLCQCDCFRRAAETRVRMSTVEIDITISSQFSDDSRIEIHLRTLSDGGHHPDALHPTIQSSRRSDTIYSISASITSSRLAVLTKEGYHGPKCLTVWDWKKAELLFVRRLFSCFDEQYLSIHVGTRRQMEHGGIRR